MQVAVDERLSFSDLGWNVDIANGDGRELMMQVSKHASNGSCLLWTFRQQCQQIDPFDTVHGHVASFDGIHRWDREEPV